MKKILALILASLMLVACVACGNNQTNDTTDPVVTIPEETTEPVVEQEEVGVSKEKQAFKLPKELVDLE